MHHFVDANKMVTVAANSRKIFNTLYMTRNFHGAIVAPDNRLLRVEELRVRDTQGQRIVEIESIEHGSETPFIFRVVVAESLNSECALCVARRAVNSWLFVNRQRRDLSQCLRPITLDCHEVERCERHEVAKK